MSANIRDRAIVESAATRLEELISACRPRKALHSFDQALTNDVMRKAKGLHTALVKLQAALDDPHHQPAKEDAPARKEPLHLRLYHLPQYIELARFLSYGGKRMEDVREKLAEMRSRFGEEKVQQAYAELTMCEEKTHLTVLTPEARRQCRQLLGPAPEAPDYEQYYRINRRTPPAEHHAPPEEEEGMPTAKKGRKR